MEQFDCLFLYKKLQTRKFKGDLDLTGMKIPKWFRIPNNLKIEGYLNLYNTNISKLPKNLQCHSLWLTNCKNLKELPEGLNVEDTISLTGSSIERLPKNLQCHYLYLRGCKNLKKLPEGLQVYYLSIEGSKLTKKYCEQLKQEGRIFYKYL